MKHAIIDMGSNSMRLSLYEIGDSTFRILFREKYMAGLAGYVENGCLSDEGIQCACDGLLSFKEILETLGIKNVSVFATASLRNIKNREEAVEKIDVATGYSVEVISGEDEALFGYTGAINKLDILNGIFVDIGGASTEIVSFADGKLLLSRSFEVGSLNLYKRCVKKILPDDDTIKTIRKEIKSSIDKDKLGSYSSFSTLVCVGGTSRAILKLAIKVFDLPENCCSITAFEFEKLCKILCSRTKESIDLILKLEPDRIHTIIPGMLIMQHILKCFKTEKIIVRKYGVREGFLCQRVLKNMNTLKTEN